VLTKGDEYPIHQTPEPIAFSGSDRNFYDRYFFCGAQADGGAYFAVAFGVYPHLNVMDAHFSLLGKDGVQRSIHASRVLDMERMNLSVGPISIEVIEPLLGNDCHVIANTLWRNGPDFEGGPWHCDAGPHVPRPADVPWDDRIPYPVFAIGVHIMLRDCAIADGPTAVLAGSHRSGRPVPASQRFDPELTYDGRTAVVLEASAGDVAMFVSDVWHHGTPANGGSGRLFLQVHYGRRDIAQRIRLTADVNHLSPEAIEWADTPRRRDLMGLHDSYFYDA
jgi:ectoine hydroxylase-related dioxygenase (phytanoyl-CoA dioxygenase family)